MAKNINEIADQLDAKIVGQVPDTGGGVFGAARLAKSVEELTMASDSADTDSDPLLGSMSDDVELMDQIVEHAMRIRELHGWRPSDEDFAVLTSITEATGQPLNELLDEALRLLLQQWNQQQAEAERRAESERRNPDRRPIWEVVRELTAAIPEEVWEEWPHNPEGIDLETADANDPETRKKLMEEMGRRMNRLSETAYCAGWSSGLHKWLPDLCDQALKTGKVQPFGTTVICPGLARRLLAMRDKLGHWVTPAIKGGYEPYPPADKA
jgi:hypothetical protein